MMARWGQPIEPRMRPAVALAARLTGEPRCRAEALLRLTDLLTTALGGQDGA